MSAACLMLALVTLAAGAKGEIVAGREYDIMNVWWKGCERRLILHDGALNYMGYPIPRFYILKNGYNPYVDIHEDEEVHDLLLDIHGTMWVATMAGIWHYFPQNKTFTKFSPYMINSLTASRNGTVYGTHLNTGALMELSGPEVRTALDIKAIYAAITNTGDVYFVNSRGLRRLEGPEKEERAIVTSNYYVWYIEMDRRDDILYVCKDEGLYLVRPGARVAERLEGIGSLGDPVSGIGFTPTGDVFLGYMDRVKKMTLLSPNRFDMG